MGLQNDTWREEGGYSGRTGYGTASILVPGGIYMRLNCAWGTSRGELLWRQASPMEFSLGMHPWWCRWSVCLDGTMGTT